jgi:hypothetical protein
MTFLKRTGRSYSEYPSVPIASSLSYSTDVRQFSGSFDFQIELAVGESFLPRSHDAVEFWVQVDGTRRPIGVGFIEDLADDSDERHTDLKANGRELLGQLINLPFKVHPHYKDQSLEIFTRFALNDGGGTYLADYLKFRGIGQPTLNQGAYANALLVVTNNFLKKAAVIQEYAELAQNLIYQNPRGQVEIYGRQTATNPLGTLSRKAGQTNVNHIRKADNFSKVVSECTVMWASSEQDVDRNNLVSPLVKNPDARVAHIYQPETRVFSSGDLLALAGRQDAEFRVRNLAKSIIRRSMANIGAVTVVLSEPFHTDPKSGKKTIFRVMQDWHVLDPTKGLDKTMRLAGIHYGQDASQLSVQLAFVEPDTLV